MGFIIPAVAAALPAIAGAAGTAGAAAGASTFAGTLAAGAEAGGSLLGALGSFQQAQAASRAASQAAIDTRVAGQYEEETSKLKYGALEATQKAEQAANGISVDSGSAEAVRASTRTIGALDAAMIHYNAAKASGNLNYEAATAKAAGVNALVGGGLKAATSLLGGAQSLSSKWDMYKQAGVGSNG